MGKAMSSIKEFAAVAFLLLGVLFGMMIMTFIFGQLGNTSVIDNEVGTVNNLTGAWINETVYTIPEASDANFAGGFSVTSALNTTDNSTILSGNYTVNAAAGTIVNATATNWDDVTLTYTWNYKPDTKLASESAQNDSLQAITSYTSQSDTQFSTVAIAVTLVILIAVFLLFWKIFIGGGKKDKGAGNFAG